VAKDVVEAVKWLRKAAEQNHAPAQFKLGWCYANGQGAAQDAVEAVKWYRKAAEQNNANAQCGLGCCYLLGQGVETDEAGAVEWFRRAAEQNNAYAQNNLGICYEKGQGVAQDEVEALKWYRRAAEQNNASAQYNLGACYRDARGVAKDEAEAVKWFRKAAEQNDAYAQNNLGVCYREGQGIAQDEAEAARWFRRAAEQNHANAQCNLGYCCYDGRGVAKDYVEAYKWCLLAAGQGEEAATRFVTILEDGMTREQIAEGQKLARTFKPRVVPAAGLDRADTDVARTPAEASGTGFFVTEDGCLITNEHLVAKRTQVRLVTEAGIICAKVVKLDVADDLALLKVEGTFAALPVVPSRAMRPGSAVATVGFPNIGPQGFAPKLAQGEIGALSGAQDDPRYFQISLPVQPGNSGGPLVDERGNVVGVVSAWLDLPPAMTAGGAPPENVNYAVKSSFLLGFLESVPEVCARLKEPNTNEREFEDVVKSAERAAVLVLMD
jgi:TPR repeat protein